MEQGSLLLGVAQSQQKVIDNSTFHWVIEAKRAQRAENHNHSLSPNMCEAPKNGVEINLLKPNSNFATANINKQSP